MSRPGQFKRHPLRMIQPDDVFAWGQTRREASAWLGLFAVVLNLLAGLGLSTSPVNASPLPPASVFAATVICTAQGMMVLGEDGKLAPAGSSLPASPSLPAYHGPACVFCLPLMQSGGLDRAAEVATPAPAFALILAEIAPVRALVRQALPAFGLPSPRGPPRFI